PHRALWRKVLHGPHRGGRADESGKVVQAARGLQDRGDADADGERGEQAARSYRRLAEGLFGRHRHASCAYARCRAYAGAESGSEGRLISPVSPAILEVERASS